MLRTVTWLFVGVALSAALRFDAAYRGPLEDLECTVEDVEATNAAQLASILRELVSTTYFRLFKADMSRPCPLDDGPSIACSVPAFPSVSVPTQCSLQTEPSDFIDTTLSPTENEALPLSSDCDDDDAPTFWLDMCHQIPTHTGQNVNLARNPEQWTGYNGSSIWEAMYRENCFGEGEECVEQRVLYRLLSGMHASTNIHINLRYFPPTGEHRWRPNPQRFQQQYGDKPELLRNLHFAYVVLLRSLDKLRPVLATVPLDTGNLDEDARTQRLMHRLLDSSLLSSCSPIFSAFDESILFQETRLKREFKNVFHNISRLLDCVTCQKCKLHGKLQLLGIGTALKTLLVPPSHLVISRDELVALINTLAQFSDAIKGIETLSASYLVHMVRDLALDTAAETRVLQALLDHDATMESVLTTYADQPATLRRVLGSSPPVVVIGGGLAGLVTALALTDGGKRVLLLDKAGIGGNSAKASSGINGITDAAATGDSIDQFTRDMDSTGFIDPTLVEALTHDSGESIAWIQQRTGIQLTEQGQLGGHSFPRTYRPRIGLAGSELIVALQRALQNTHNFQWERGAVDTLLTDGAHVVGLVLSNGTRVDAEAVVLATGGYGSDFGPDSMLLRYRPELYHRGTTTNGPFATGDGHRLAASVGAELVDMHNVQVHPTGFVDPQQPQEPRKTLAAEILRGVGGVLLQNGQRFCNELGTRRYVTSVMQSLEHKGSFWLLLGSEAMAQAQQHVPMYTRKGLLLAVDTVEAAVATMSTSAAVLRTTLEEAGITAPFVVGQVEPVLHYCMGGVRTSATGQALRADKTPIEGLYIAGELMGGIHGNNRLGGNALTECVVFGRAVARSLIGSSVPSQLDSQPLVKESTHSTAVWTAEDVAEHASPHDCWLALEGKVYDMTAFAEEHPGGASLVLDHCGTDATAAFQNVHSSSLLDVFTPIGTLRLLE